MKSDVNNESKLFYSQLARFYLDTDQGWEGEYRDRLIEMLRPLWENTEYSFKKNTGDKGNGNKRIIELFLDGHRRRKMGIEYHKTKHVSEKICCWFNLDFYEEHLPQRDFPVTLPKNKTQPVGRWSVVQLWDAICLITGKTHYCVNRIAPIDEQSQEDFAEAVERIDREIIQLDIHGEERDALVKIRVNQGEFRKRLMNRYGKCCLCGVAETSVLTASHIKPWSQSESFEKLDIDNGFLLCPNHDKLFDKGLISFDDEGRIMISEKLSDTDRVFMNADPSMRIALTDENKGYLAYHRERVYKG